MKICCLIDSLNSGGAQRQMTWLIRSLVGLGHEVRLLTYYRYDHYLADVHACGVQPENIDGGTKLGRFRKVRAAVRKDRPDCIISFLDTPNFYGLFAALRPARIPIIVSERNHDIGGVNRANRIRFNAFRLADRVVTNCWSQNEFVRQHFPFLKGRLTTILNCVDLERFSARTVAPDKPLKLIVGASVCERKNTLGLIKASERLARQNVAHTIDWFGNNFFQNGQPTPQSQYFLACRQRLAELDNTSFTFHLPVGDIENQLARYHACCLPSFREGCPNILCEAMASGLPVLASQHGDMNKMILESGGGFLFDPSNPESMASAIRQLNDLPNAELAKLGERNRRYAEEQLGPQRFAREYQQLLEEVVE